MRTKEKEQQIKNGQEAVGICINLIVSCGAWLRQGWGPLAWQMGSLAVVPNGKGGGQADVQLY